jgi:HJR/Mrr/RecB family endonuclease
MSKADLIDWVTFAELRTVHQFFRSNCSASASNTVRRIYELRRWKELEASRNILEERYAERLKESIGELEDELDRTNDTLLEKELEIATLKEIEEDRQLEAKEAQRRTRGIRQRELEARKKEQRRQMNEGKSKKELAELLRWASTVPWPVIDQFMIEGKAKGLPAEFIEELICVHTNRRWVEEEKVRKQIAQANKSAREDSLIRIAAKELRELHTELTAFTSEYALTLSAAEFESFVARVFSAFGYRCEVIGGGLDDGVDVTIWIDDSLYGVCQCKRYADKSISSSQIRDFVGAFIATDAKRGFFFTTSRFTEAARRTADNISCVDLYDLDDLKSFVESACKRIEQKQRGALPLTGRRT